MNLTKNTSSYEVRGDSLFKTGESKSSADGDFTIFEKPNTILRLPLVKDSTWSDSSDDMDKTVRIVDILNKYSVIAGEFSDVLKIEGKLYKINKKTRRYPQKPTVISYDYYAPNIGLIKQEVLINKKIRRVRELVTFNTDNATEATESKKSFDSQIESWILAKRCPKGVKMMIQLYMTNPFDNKGMCFNINYPLRTFQLLSRTEAIFSVASEEQHPLAYFDFGKKSVPGDFWSGLARGNGAYQYESASGALVTIHRLEPLN
jgi:hypothetical protein